MTTIAARYVRKPRRRYICDGCNKPIAGPHVWAYGDADDNTPPFAIRLHPECCAGTKDAKIQSVLPTVNHE